MTSPTTTTTAARIEDEAPLGFGLAETTSSNPTRQLLSAHDLATWLAGLPPEDRRMLALRAAGHTLEETASEFGVSISSVFANRRRLGLTVAVRAEVWVELKKTRKSGRRRRRRVRGSRSSQR